MSPNGSFVAVSVNSEIFIYVLKTQPILQRLLEPMYFKDLSKLLKRDSSKELDAVNSKNKAAKPVQSVFESLIYIYK